MDFKEVLSKLIKNTPGGVGSALVAKDGLIVEIVCESSLNLEEIAVHITPPLIKSEDSSRHADLGKFTELLLFTDKYSLIMKNLTDEYFLILVIDQKDGIYGKGRYEADKIIQKLRSELL